MTTVVNGNAAFITEHNQHKDESDQEAVDSDNSGEEERNSQIFNIREAIPPTDFDAPYSKMPKSVVIVISRVK